MDAYALVTRIRAHYLVQYLDFLEAQEAEGGQGAAEAKFRLGDSTILFNQMYCVDYVRNEGPGGMRMIEFAPAASLAIPRLEGVMGDTQVSIESFSWDDVEIEHDLAAPPFEALQDWFEHWFDPEERRFDADTQLAHAIHSLMVEPGRFTLDLGTAPEEAFWSLLSLLSLAGARQARVARSPMEG